MGSTRATSVVALVDPPAVVIHAVVQRDARDLARISRLDALARLLEVATTHTGRLFNASRLAAPSS